jgi:hypothetical protein
MRLSLAHSDLESLKSRYFLPFEIRDLVAVIGQLNETVHSLKGVLAVPICVETRTYFLQHQHTI